MKSNLFQGVWTALITPFQADGSLDLDSFQKLLDHQVQGGVTGVVINGTTGESPTLTKDEKKLLISTAVKALKGTPVRVMAGTGSNSTADTVEFTQWAKQAGVHGVLLVTPYYNKPTQGGLLKHFQSVASACDVEQMLYQVPGRTGVSLSPESVSALAAHPNITAIKDATGNMNYASDVRDALIQSGAQLNLLSGDDTTYLPFLSLGGVGTVSVLSNLFPKQLVNLHQAVLQNRWADALALHENLYPICRDLFIESNPGPIKFCLHEIGLSRPFLRLPLVQISEKTAQQLRRSMAAVQGRGIG